LSKNGYDCRNKGVSDIIPKQNSYNESAYVTYIMIPEISGIELNKEGHYIYAGHRHNCL
jgi:hypothetical protein